MSRNDPAYHQQYRADHREEMARYQRGWWKRNGARVYASRSAAKKALIENAKRVPCMDCGKSYPPHVMDFDHRPGETKCFQIGGTSVMRSLETIRREIAKCDVVCANCHRERTHRRG